ncbi:MAG: AMP-binding protein, partial [Candidatus Eremiobacteraeota bacterium]|nr:AMP-binding protein [Candidatus Eremiobacteraeota bacterium]
MKFLEALLGAGEREDRYVEFQSGPELTRLSMAELIQAARGRAGGLLECGVEPGQVVAVAGTTHRDTVEAILGVWLAGAVPTVLPLPARMGRMEEYSRSTQAKLSACRASLLLSDEAFVESQQPVLSLPCRSFSQLKGEAAAARSTELGLIQFSSGTTREPSPVALEREAMLANVRAMLARFPGDPSLHSCVSWLPLYHDMGFIGCLLSALVAQGNLTLLRPEEFVARPIAWLEALTRTRATTSPAPNFALALCCERVREKQLGKLDLSNWSVALIGAEPVQRP